MAAVVKRVVVLIQENHTTDNYFRGLAPFGAAVASDWPLSPNPPTTNPSNGRRAYFDWLTGSSTAPPCSVRYARRAPVLPRTRAHGPVS